MNKKSLLGLIAAGLLSVGTAYGTYAWFTSQATSTGNVFQTGTLSIVGPGQITSNLSVGNIFPSWTTTKIVTITNSGSIPFKYRVSVFPLAGNLLYDGPTPLQISISRKEDNVITVIKDFTNINELGAVDLETLNEKDKEGSSAQFVFGFKLPEGADNAYQGRSADLTFLFDAIQKEAADFNGVKSKSFSYFEQLGVKGYNTEFELVGFKAKDLSSAEVSLYKDDLLLAKNTSKSLNPTATILSSLFDIDGVITGGGLDESWNYGTWDVNHLADVPNKAVIKVTTKDGLVYTAINTNCVPNGPIAQ